MTDNDASAKSETLARLAQSRADIRRVLERPPRVTHEEAAEGVADDSQAGTFPRSRTMKMLMSGRGIGTLGAVVGGLFMARPALALRVLRLLPTGAVARMLMVKAVAALRNGR